MSGLTIFSDKAPQQPLWQSRDAQEIQRQLAQIGVRFERWQADRELGDNPQPEAGSPPTSMRSTGWWRKRATRVGT